MKDVYNGVMQYSVLITTGCCDVYELFAPSLMQLDCRIWFVATDLRILLLFVACLKVFSQTWDQHISGHTGLLRTYALRLVMLQLAEAKLLCGYSTGRP